MPTWSEIQLWKAATLSSYVDTVSSKKQTIDQQIATLQARRTSFQGEGQTADALRNAMSTAHKELSNLAEELRHVHIAITQATGRVQQVESLVANTLSSASARHCTISDSGTVTCTFGHDFSVRHKLESEVQSMVRNAIRAAEQVDNDFRALLTNVGTARTAPAYRARGTHALSKAEEAAFAKMTPQQRADYWSQQSDEQKKFLCDNYPDLIGNADGVEAWARDRANRRRLPKLKQAAQNDLDRVNKELYASRANAIRRRALEARKKELEAQVASYKAIESQLNEKGRIRLEDYQHGAKGEPFSLLTLQVEDERVLAAVARGDVDHAKNVATIVPGISTTVNEKLGGEIDRAGVIRDAAVAEGKLQTKDVAVVSWLGYKAPGGFDPLHHPLDSLNNLPDIATSDLAEKGAVKLAGFETGLAASRKYGAGAANITLIGHSYGSVVSGMATTMTQDGDVNNVILCGSPGMGTYDPSDIHVPKGRRFVSGIPTGDFIQGLGSIRAGVGELGKDPLDDDSSYTHISGDATRCKDYNPEAGPSLIAPDTTNHSNYICRGTEISRDMGRIVAGQDPRRYYYDYPLTNPTRPIA